MNKTEYVRDATGRLIGRINHDKTRDNISDGHGRHLGHTDEHGTRDNAGRKIADKPEPGLLWRKK